MVEISEQHLTNWQEKQLKEAVGELQESNCMN
jgi:hypothetical protein